MEAARRVIPEVFAEFGRVTGRPYAMLDGYRMEDAEVGAILINSPPRPRRKWPTSCARKGRKVGVISPNVMRPFPARGDSSGAARREGRHHRRPGRLLRRRRRQPLARGAGRAETRSRQRDPGALAHLRPGRQGLHRADAEVFFAQAAQAPPRKSRPPAFAYHGATPGRPDSSQARPAADPPAEVSRAWQGHAGPGDRPARTSSSRRCGR